MKKENMMVLVLLLALAILIINIAWHIDWISAGIGAVMTYLFMKIKSR